MKRFSVRLLEALSQDGQPTRLEQQSNTGSGLSRFLAAKPT